MQFDLINEHLNTLMLSTCRYRHGVMIANCGYNTLGKVEDLATGGGCWPTDFEYGLTDDDDIPAAYGSSALEAMTNLEAKYVKMRAAGVKEGCFENVLEALEQACGEDWKPIYEQLCLAEREDAELRERSNQEYWATGRVQKGLTLSLMTVVDAEELAAAFSGTVALANVAQGTKP